MKKSRPRHYRSRTGNPNIGAGHRNSDSKRTLITDLIKEEKKEVVLDVGEGEKLTYLLISFGGEGERKVTVNLTGPDASVQILGVLIGRSKEIRLKTTQHHQTPGTKSDLLIKTVLFDKSKFTYDGLIRIEKEARGSDACQRNENLVIGKKARVDNRPALEILANDVGCTHAVTVGKIDEEALFYLMSRGVDLSEAQGLIIAGFFEPVIKRLPAAGATAQIRERLEQVLSKQKLI